MNDLGGLGVWPAIVAVLPIAWLFVSLGFLKMPADKACPLGLLFSLLIAVLAWHMPALLALRAALEGFVLALVPIMWVIVAAFYTYNISLRTGAMERIKNLTASLSEDRRIQTLIIAWGFGGFMEGAAGFGTAVAIPAAILISLGFAPFAVVVICLIANTVAVAFGVIGIPVTTLAKITDLPVMPLSWNVALQLTPFVIIVPFILVLSLTKSVKGLNGVWLTTFLAGASFAAVQLLITKFVGPELAALAAAIVSVGVIVVSVKIFPPATPWRFPQEPETGTAGGIPAVGSALDQLIAWAPYIMLLFLAMATKLIPEVNAFLGQANSALAIYNGPGGKPLYVDWLLTPGTLIMFCAVAGGIIQGATGRALVATFAATLIQFKSTFITVLAIVGMAKVLSYSGMVGAIAVSLAVMTGGAYPLIAPAIGALGTFLTGSDTSANVLFGGLQKETALKIGADAVWIAAANTSGACAGKMISPQSIAIAASAAGLTGKEGDFFGITIRYVLGFIIMLGIITYIFSF